MTGARGHHVDPQNAASIEALRAAVRRPAGSAIPEAPLVPGVYAWWARRPKAAQRIGSTEAGTEVPLYVGLAGKSLRSRLSQYLLPQRRGRTEFRADLTELLVMTGSLPPSDRELFGGGFELGPSVLETSLDEAVGAVMKDELDISWIEVHDSKRAGAIERAAIRQMSPVSNIAHVDEARRFDGDDWMEVNFSREASHRWWARFVGFSWSGYGYGSSVASVLRGHEAIEVTTDDWLEPISFRVVGPHDTPPPEDPERRQHRIMFSDLRTDDAAALEVLGAGPDWPSGVGRPTDKAVLGSLTTGQRYDIALFHAGARIAGAWGIPDP